jgi:uroporphyrin-3 C-methyltransferase
MSEDNTSSNEDIDQEDVAEDEPTETAADEATPQGTPRAQRKSGGLVAWLALIVAAIAVAAAGLDYLRDQGADGAAAQSDARIQNLTASISATQAALASVEQSVSALTELDTEKNAAIDRLNRQLNDRLRQLESMPGRLATLESTMSSLQGISTGARDAWFLAEAEYYMQIANAQLQLANNPELAMLALTHADERIVQLGDPRLTGIRQALSDELRALEAMDKPDTAGITLTLASLASVVDSLPLRQDAASAETSEPTGIDPELTGMDRAWASVRNAMDGVVKVREADEVARPLVAPEAQYFLRANLALQLQAARLALLRGEDEVFRQSLDDADAWLGDYYAADSTAVQSARETIAEIRDSVLRVAMPDISQSLRLVRQFNTLSEAAGAAESNNMAEEPAEQTADPEQDQ